MKKIGLFAAFVFISIACFSQDLLLLKRGTKLEVVVTEITPTLVRYKLFSDPNGHGYFVYKDNVAKITYKDGRVETFDSPDNNQPVVAESKSVPQENENKSVTQDNENKNVPQENETKSVIQDNENKPSNPVVDNRDVENTVKSQKNEGRKDQTENTVSQPNNTKTQPERTKTQPNNTKSQSNNTKNQSDQTESQSKVYSQPIGKGNDFIYLNNGDIIQGNIIEQTPDQSVTIKTADGNVATYSTDDINKVIQGTGTDDSTSSSGRNRRSSGSESESSEHHSGYQGIVDMGYYLGVGTPSYDRVGFNFINGYRINPNFSAGIGVGVNYYLDDKSYFIPVFADLRAHYDIGHISPFVSFDIGYSFDASNSFKGMGILINPSTGVGFKISESNEILVGIGYQMQGIIKNLEGEVFNSETSKIDWPTSHINSGAVVFKVGFSF